MHRLLLSSSKPNIWKQFGVLVSSEATKGIQRKWQEFCEQDSYNTWLLPNFSKRRGFLTFLLTWNTWIFFFFFTKKAKIDVMETRKKFKKMVILQKCNFTHAPAVFGTGSRILTTFDPVNWYCFMFSTYHRFGGYEPARNDWSIWEGSELVLLVGGKCDCPLEGGTTLAVEWIW